MSVNGFGDKKIAVLGLGIEGIALAKFLGGKAMSITLLDELSEKELLKRAGEDKNQALLELLEDQNDYQKRLGHDYLNNLDDFEVIFRTPGLPYLNPKIQEAKKSGVIISSQIKLFFDLCPCPIVGVTGTKGKGTTASLIYEILKKNNQFPISNPPAGGQINSPTSLSELRGASKSTNQLINNVYLAGNIGKPAISLIGKVTKDDLVILELSSFQLQDLHKSPYISVITNISLDHLDYHKDENEYKEAKKAIFSHQTNTDYLVVNSNIESNYYKEAKSKVIKFSGSVDDVSEAKVVDGGDGGREVCLMYGDKWKKVAGASEINLVGEHNLQNIAAAALVSKTLGCNIKNIRKGAKNFRGLMHRLELVEEIKGVKFYNDSFATNPEPTMAAIDSFSNNKILILGGSSKGADFNKLAKKIAGSKVSMVVLIGSEAGKINKALAENQYQGEVFNANNDFSNAVKKAYLSAKPKGTVVFSPACASFDMFKNYKDRGQKFRAEVKKLID